MKKQLFVYFLSLFFVFGAFAQYPAVKNSTGNQYVYPKNTAKISLLAFGGKADNTTDNSAAMQQAIKSANGKPLIIEIPTGNYVFKKPVSLPSGIVLRGAGSDKTVLHFQLNGAGDAISIQGKQDKLSTSILSGTTTGSRKLNVSNAAGFAAGDFVAVKQSANHLLASNWAFNTFFQIVQITSISANAVTINEPLRMDFPSNNQPVLVKLQPVQHTGIESLKIKRTDATSGQSAAVFFNYAVHCFVKGVEFENANYAHITLQSSAFTTISGNYFHDAFDYGSGGKGYGVVMQFGAGDNLIYDNIFKKLRHAILLQATANGNTIAYNYSYEPYWTQGFFPNNSAGDIVLHGNYPYANLVEGNIFQNLVIDNSHGINGPDNTFFRNRIESYGVVMNSNSGENMYFIANEITGSGLLKGLYSLSGNHTSVANNIKGNQQPGSVKESSLISKDYASRIGAPNALNSWTNEAYKRNGKAVKTTVHSEKITSATAPVTSVNADSTEPVKKVKKKCRRKR